MKDGFIKVAAASLDVKVADCAYHAAQVTAAMDRAEALGVHVLTLPELCLTGYSCQDLFLQPTLQQGAWKALEQVVEHSRGMEVLTFVGLPYLHKGKLYNCAAAVQNGKLLALIPKTHIPNYGEFYEGRYFTPAGEETQAHGVPFGTHILFTCPEVPELTVGCELCEDLWAPGQPSQLLAREGATVVVNLSASPAVVGKREYRRALVSGQSARLICGYVYACASCQESTQDTVGSGHNLICENGTMLAESRTMEPDMIVTELDVLRLASQRAGRNTYPAPEGLCRSVDVHFTVRDTTLTRPVEPLPFAAARALDHDRCEEILDIQAAGLAKRLAHTHAKTAVVGLSGGLDSTLALLVMVRAADRLGWDRNRLWAITMPCYGTTGRTRSNAESMALALGVSFREIPIGDAVAQHFKDIGLSESDRSVTYENGQARERTQVLMDFSNLVGGLVIGTGDLSELALGWATYNGDHMSMYGVNAGVPKTLVRGLVSHVARHSDEALKKVLLDILDTPVSPELLPPAEGEISQRTEDLVGPYELHDFFLYQLLRYGDRPRKVFRLAKYAFQGEYEDETIQKWLHTFCRRFFQQQFKRSCLPDGPKIGSVSLSPRGDWRMPSDAMAVLWLEDLQENL